MKDLLPRKLSLKLNFDNHKKEYHFEEPTLRKMLEFHRFIQDEKYTEAVKSIVELPEKYFWANPWKILNAITGLIYGEVKWSKQGYFPAIIDMFAHRYGTNPLEIMEFTISQIQQLSKGMEYNMNIQNGQSHKNVKIENEWKLVTPEEQQQIDALNKMDFSKYIK